MTSSAAATAVFTISGNSVTYTLTVNTLPATAISSAHIHAGTATGGTTPAGVGGGQVRVTLCGGSVAPGNQACPTTAGGSVTGTWTYASGTAAVEGTPTMTYNDLYTAVRTFVAYANIHTSGNPGGELRGQVVNQAQ